MEYRNIFSKSSTGKRGERDGQQAEPAIYCFWVDLPCGYYYYYYYDYDYDYDFGFDFDFDFDFDSADVLRTPFPACTIPTYRFHPIGA